MGRRSRVAELYGVFSRRSQRGENEKDATAAGIILNPGVELVY